MHLHYYYLKLPGMQNHIVSSILEVFVSNFGLDRID